MAAKSENFKPTITKSQKEKLIRLADKYETKDFLKEDPSQFLYYYNTPQDIELCSFIAALLSVKFFCSLLRCSRIPSLLPPGDFCPPTVIEHLSST